MKKEKNILKGGRLTYNASIQMKYSRAIRKLIERMTKVTKKEVMKLFKSNLATEFFATDESIAAQAKILLNSLTKRFESLFSSKARDLANGMADQVEKSSAQSLKVSMKKMSNELTLNTSIVPEDGKIAAQAVVNESTDLIK